jgi:tripartite-type tricarboxylate transporter receptor subunit TctC
MSLAIVVMALASAAAWSQTYPSRPIEFVVHTSPGGGTDVFARAVTEMLVREKLFAQPLTVANRTGGGGAIAFNHIKSKRGDPHFVLTIATGSLLTAASRPDLDLGLETYTPLAFFALDPQVIAVPADSKFTNMKELIEAGRREPNAIVGSIASATGTGRQLLYVIERETGAKFKFVSFKSGAEAATAVLGGHVPFTTENLSEMYPHVGAKKMRVLAVTGDKRLPAVPEAPTLKELGYQISVGTGRGFAMPAGVPREAAATMEAALKRVHDSQAWKDFSAKFMFDNMYMGSEEFAQFLVKRRQETQGFLEYIGLGKKP